MGRANDELIDMANYIVETGLTKTFEEAEDKIIGWELAGLDWREMLKERKEKDK